MEANMMAWIKDAAAGVGLLAFIASSFVLANAMQAVLANI
jgi:hypothetical protein